MKAQGTALKDAKVVFYGAGSSAVGVAMSIVALLQKEAGLTREQAMKVPACPWPGDQQWVVQWLPSLQ